MKFTEQILAEFEPDVALALIEFGKSLSSIDADLLVFMARKSLCLYDVLLRLGIPAAKHVILSDRVFDLRLDNFRGKRIALIDDSLIVGKTLAKTKLLLEIYGQATVEVHVFCIDETWWCKDLISPDSVMLKMDDKRVMTFCTSEVRALSILPRPYLVDFPISNSIRLSKTDFDALVVDADWIANKLSTRLQEQNRVGTYTFFPEDSILRELTQGFGKMLSSCFDLIKVRAFVRQHDDEFWMQLVPIMTLKPLQEDELSRLLEGILSKIGKISGVDLQPLLYYAESPISQHRLVQYCCSAALGHRFMNTLKPIMNYSTSLNFDDQEAERHYGPWLRDEMATVGRDAFRALWSSGESFQLTGGKSISPAILPNGVSKWANGLLRSANPMPWIGREESSDPQMATQTAARNPQLRPEDLVADFTEIFLHLYNISELPARKEAQRQGKLALRPENLRSRDRLEKGIPWVILMQHWQQRYLLTGSRQETDLFSLILDMLNDLGIAVPITCYEEGIVYRAYRYGEDILFSEGHLMLAYEAINGFLVATDKTTIPRTVLEKLLVFQP